MNTAAVNNVVIELSDDRQPAEIMTSWAERPSDTD